MSYHPFLVEIRPGSKVKKYVREIISDVQSTFDVHGAARGHVVPHITLFGPFNADGYSPVLSAIRNACVPHSVVPYRLDGFSHFRRDVIYIDIATSPELRSIRRSIRDELLPKTTPRRRRQEAKRHLQYHITVAFKDIQGQFSDIWKYVNQHYAPNIDTYAYRIAFLNKGRLINEWDMLSGEFIGPKNATSRRSWEKTMGLIENEKTPTDHAKLSKPHSGPIRKCKKHVYRLLG